MKNIIISLILVSISGQNYSQELGCKALSNKLFSDVVMAPVSTVLAKKEGIKKCSVYEQRGTERRILREFTYDSAGNEIGHKLYFRPNQQSTNHVSAFDSLGNLTSEMHYDTLGNLISTEEYEYENKILLKRFTLWVDRPDRHYKIEYTYNQEGQLISENEEPSKGDPKYKTTYRYDSLGTLVQILYYDDKGKLKVEFGKWRFNLNGYFEYKYDQQDSIISAKEFDINGELWAKYKLKRTTDGKVSSETKYGNSGKVWSYNEFEYNEKGKLILEKSFFDDTKTDRPSQLTYKYDKNGLIIEHEQSNWGGVTYFFKYSK